MKVQLLHPDAKIPARSTDGAAGLDLYACEPGIIMPGEREVIRTGLVIAIPHGCVGLIWPRSGLAVNHGIDILAGVIDSDFRGDVGVVAINHGHKRWRWDAGDRVAQLIVQLLWMADPELSDSLPPTERSESGWGSTGR